MKRIILLSVFFFFLCCSWLGAQNFKGKDKEITIGSPAESLKVGESLEYSAQWLGIPVGRIVLKIDSIVKLNNHRCYHIIGRACPNKFFTAFYDLEYEVHTFLDTVSLRPLRFEKKRRIKDKINDTIIDFDWDKKEADFRSQGMELGVNISPLHTKISRELPNTNKISSQTQDLLSSLYYFRLLNIEPDKIYSLDIYYGEKNWPIEIKVDKPSFKEIHKKGTFSTFRASVNSIITDFILGKRRFVVYFTSDSRRIPIEFEVATAIGSMRCRLQELPK